MDSFDADRLHRNGSRVPVSVHTVAVMYDGDFAGTGTTYRPQDHSGPFTHTDENQLVTEVIERRALQAALTAPLYADMARGVAVLNVDGFALVNQTFGPDAGDEVLRQIGHRLNRGWSGEGRCVSGCWQADEFVYVLDTSDPQTTLDTLITEARRAVAEPIAVAGQRLHLTRPGRALSGGSSSP